MNGAMTTLTLADMMTRPAVTVHPDCRVGEALKLLLDEQIGALAVAEHQQPVGVFTERDALLLSRLENAADRLVSEAMHQAIRTAPADTSLPNAAQLMDASDIDYLIVVDDDQSVLGLVSQRDIARRRDELELAQLRRNLERRERELADAHSELQSLQTLRRTEARLVKSQRVAKVCSWEYDHRSDSLWWSQEAAEILGSDFATRYATVEAFFDLVHPDDRERAMQTHADVENHITPHDIDLRFSFEDGREKYVNLHSRTFYDDTGQALTSIGTLQDVTERSREQRQIAKLAADLARAQAIAHIGNWSYRMADSHIEWSLETYRIFGRDPAATELNYVNLLSWIHPDDRTLHDAFLQRMARLTPGEDIDNLHYRIIRPDGEQRWIDVSLEGEFDEQGRPVAFFGALQDISARLEAEHDLRRSEANLRRAQAAGGVGIWEYDLVNQTANISEEFQRILGLGQACYPLEKMFACVPPEDAKNIEAVFNAALSGQSSYDITHRIIRQDNGEVRWVHAHAELVRDRHDAKLALLGTSQDVTEQKLAELSLRESEQRFRSIFEQAAVGVALVESKTGRFMRINQRYCDMLGYSIEEVSGKKTFQEIVHPEDLPEDLDKMAQLLTGEIREFSREKRYLRKDGSLLWVNLTVSPTWEPDEEPQSHIAVVVDINERKRSELATQASDFRYHSLFDNMSDGVAVYQAIDEGGDFIFRDINRAGEGISRVTRQQILGKRVTALFPGIREMGLLDVFQRVWKTGAAENFPMRSYQDERLQLWVENHVLRLPSGEIVAIYSDSTERKQAEVEQGRLQRELAQARKMEALGQLTGGIAHDFNNMLAIILGGAELLRLKMPLDKRLHGYLDNIMSAGKRASDLVARMMAFSRKNAQEPQLLPLLPMVKEFLKLSRSTIPSSIEFHEDLHSTPEILIDPIEVQQVLMNLFINARDAMQGKGELRISLKTLEVSNHECTVCHKLVSGEWVELAVQDNGPGISETDQAHLFEPFFTTKPVGKGTGMGLAVVHGVMERAQGHIMLESPQNGGARFRLLFPIADEVKVSGTAEDIESQQTQSLSFSGKALIVDDEPMITLFLEELLTPTGMEVAAFNSSIEALSAIRQAPQSFDLIVTDQLMPELTGMAFVEALRKLNADVPVILLTGLSAAIDADRIARLGVNQLLTKPIDLKAFFATLKRLLKSQDADARLHRP